MRSRQHPTIRLHFHPSALLWGKLGKPAPPVATISIAECSGQPTPACRVRLELHAERFECLFLGTQNSSPLPGGQKTGCG
jgi:hypothetical protein